MTFQFRTYCCL